MSSNSIFTPLHSRVSPNIPDESSSLKIGLTYPVTSTNVSATILDQSS